MPYILIFSCLQIELCCGTPFDGVYTITEQIGSGGEQIWEHEDGVYEIVKQMLFQFQGQFFLQQRWLITDVANRSNSLRMKSPIQLFPMSFDSNQILISFHT